MENETAIANAALNEVGGGSLTDWEADTTTHARNIQRWFRHTRDALLRRYTWNFALARQALSQDSSGPSFEFTNSYSLPTNPYCLRALVMYDSASEWRVEGRKLLTDDSTVNLKYISKVTDPVQFDDLFTEAFIFRLAANIAFPVMRDKVLARELYKIYLEKIADAITADSMEGSQDGIESQALTNVRLTGSTISSKISVTSSAR